MSLLPRLARDLWPGPLSRIALFLVTLLALIPGRALSSAQETGLPDLEGGTRAALEAVVEAVDGSTDQITPLLERQGNFQPFMAPEEWRRMPAMRKVVLAYHYAEAAEVGSGDKLLALLSKDLAQMYGAPEHDPRLRAYLDLDVAESSVRFRQPPPGVPLPELPDNVRSALREVANYAQGSQFGGMNNVLRDYLGLSTSQADHLLSSSASSVEALERALTIAPEDQLQRGMQRLVADVQRAHPSARDLSALQRLHPSSLWNGPPPPSGGAVSASAPRTPRGPRPGTRR